MPITNFKTVANFSDGIITVKECNGFAWGGRFGLTGNVSVKPFSANVSLSIANILASEFFTHALDNKNISGYLSVSAGFSTLGKSIYELISNLYGNFEIAGKDISLTGFDVEKIILAAANVNPQKKYNMNELTDLLSQLFTGTTVFHDVSASLSSVQSILQVTKLSCQSTNSNGSLNGNIDLRNLDSSLAASFVFSPAAGNNPVHLPIELRGQLNALNPKVNSDELREYMVK